jgi:HTH-type transcriptional regulator/antitoxin HigA
MMVKIINNDFEYQKALKKLSSLLKQGDRSEEDENTIEILLLVIKDFDQKHSEPFEVDPIEAIKFRMEQMNLRQKDMVPYFGSISKVSEVLNGKRPLSISMIRKLHKDLEIPLKSLIGEKKPPIVASGKIDYTLFPLKEMQNRGYFGKDKKSPADLKEYGEELITEFCGDYSHVLEQNIALLRAPLHRRGKRQLNPYNLAIWQISVLKKAALTYETLPEFDSKIIDRKWLRELMTLSQYNNGHVLAKEHLEKAGITLVIEPHFAKTFLDGAAIMYNGKPIIALTLRHNRIDNFWFVLAHELAHIMKHMGNEPLSFFIDDLDECKHIDAIEKEADLIANEALIPSKLWESSNILNVRRYSEIEAFAKKVKVNPAIIAGRIRYCKNDVTLFPKFIKSISF